MEQAVSRLRNAAATRPPGHQRQLSFWNHVQNRCKYRDAGTDEFHTRTTRAAYYSSISFNDFNIGRILESLGVEIDETFVVFASNHGEMLGDFGAFGKRCMLEGAVRVPLIMRWPDRRASGKRVGSPVSLVDLRQLREDGERKYVYSHFSEKEWGHYLIMDGRWK